MADSAFRVCDFLVGLVHGILMGAANVVPGVSGGTVALVLGIYRRLVTAIARLDVEFLRLLRGGRLREAAARVDFWFLASLGAGVALSTVALGGLMNYLVTDPGTRPQTLAAFFGLILASTALVARMIPWRGARDAAVAAVAGLAGAGFAFWLTGLTGASRELTMLYVFVCGLVAICAMILPGISGAYVLLIMGAYVHLTNILKRLPHGDVNLRDLATVVVFGAGCAIGLVAFSKVLRWLLARYESLTMALLCGFMCGALRKIWPFQQDMTPEVAELKRKIFVNYWPRSWDWETISCVGIAALAMFAVLIADRWGRKRLGGGRPAEREALSA